ncbi:hypothetical protein MTR67_019227, partial [Solanum verrucosum]
GDRFDIDETTNDLTELSIDEPQIEGVRKANACSQANLVRYVRLYRGHLQGGRGGNQRGREGRGNGNARRGNVQPGRDMVCQDDRAQCYAFPGKNVAEASDAVVCDRMANVLFDPGSTYSYGKIRVEGVYKPKQAKIISSIRASKLVGQGCLAYLAHVRDVEVETPSIESIPVVSEFREVFPNDLPGMPLYFILRYRFLH